MKNLALSAGECNRRRPEGGFIEIQRSRRAVRFRAFGQKSCEHRGQPAQRKYEGRRQCQIERGVEIGSHTRCIRLESAEGIGNRMQERKHERTTNKAIEEVS